MTLVTLLAPAPPTNISDARAIRATSQKLQPAVRPSGFSRVARAAEWSPTDRECDTLQQSDGGYGGEIFRLLCLKPLGKSDQGQQYPETDPQS